VDWLTFSADYQQVAQFEAFLYSVSTQALLIDTLLSTSK
jgi:hypothetical protein